jgi:hypothetical protein
VSGASLRSVGRPPYQVLQQTGHAIHGSSCFSVFSRVSRLLNSVVRGHVHAQGSRYDSEDAYNELC